VCVNVPYEIRLTLRQGTVYYMADRNLSSSLAHYFIVLNNEPLSDSLLLLSVVTSQIDKVHRRRKNKKLPESTVVEVMECDYQDFTKDCCIDCNKVIAKPLAELCQQWHRKEIRPMTDIPAAVMKIIIAGIQQSPLVSAEDKLTISPSHEN